MTKKILSAFALLLCASFFIRPVQNVKAQSVFSTDFSNNGYYNSSLNGADLLERCLKLDLFEGERASIEEKTDFVLKYYSDIPRGCVTCKLDEPGLKIDVKADKFSYCAANGMTVEWTPYSVNGVDYNGGSCEIPVSAEDYVSVIYRAEFILNCSAVNELLNFYYNEAKAASEKIKSKEAEYQSALSKYQSDVQNYKAYLEDLKKYELDCAAYENYKAEYSEWKRKNDLYVAYLAEYADYLRELEDYNNYDVKYQQYLNEYARYNEYLAECKDYQAKYEEYRKMLDDPTLNKVSSQLDILEYLDMPAGDSTIGKRTLKGAITGNAVTQVISRLQEIKSKNLRGMKIDPNSVESAAKATITLRDLISKYESCVSENDKYSYYISNYEALKANFSELLRTLDYLYSTDMVKGKVEEKNWVPQFRILLAQLFEISNALDNNAIGNYEKTHYVSSNLSWTGAKNFDSGYRIDGLLPSEILNGATLADTNDAVPLSDGVPNIPAEPTPPKPVEQPVAPGARPAQPVAPDEIPYPGPEPEKISEPVAPEKVDLPDEPVKYSPTEQESDLSGKLERGEIKARVEYNSDVKVFAETEVKRYFRNFKSINVSFWKSRGDSQPLYRAIAEAGVAESNFSVTYKGELPVKNQTGYTCVFECWEDEFGNPVDLNNLPSDCDELNLYPRFTEIPELYDVIWVIDGTEYPSKAAYDSYPQYDGPTPYKPADGDGREYRFTGWDRDIEKMTCETARYTAVFERSVLITWKFYASATVTSVWPDDIPEFNGIPERPRDSYYFYTFLSWDRKIEPAVAGKDEVYTAVFEKNYIVPLGDGGAEVGENGENQLFADCSRLYQNKLSIGELTRLAAADNLGILIKFLGLELSFNPSETKELFDSGADAVLIKTEQILFKQYRYFVEIESSGGNEFIFTFKASGVFDPVSSHLYRLDEEGNSFETRFKLLDNQISFSMTAGYVYEIYPQYSVSVINNGIAEVYTDLQLAKFNQKVTVFLGELADGRFFEKFYAQDADGNRITVSADNTFIMPQTDVIVGAECGFCEYNVTFIADGKVISNRKYRYGETVEPPSMVFKASDGVNSYTFAGWDKEIVSVTENAEYTAVFTAEKLKDISAEPASGMAGFIIWAFNNFALICVCSALFIAVLTTCIILAVKTVRKKRNCDKKP